MKHAKMLGLFATAAVAVMAFAGTASATLTESPGDPVDEGDTIHAESTDTTVNVGYGAAKCALSTITVVGSKNGGTAGTFETLRFFGGCAFDTVPVLNQRHAGTLAISSGGTITTSGAEITVQVHRTIFGFPVTTHCTYKTEGADIGALEGGTEPEIQISASIPAAETDGACKNLEWRGSYDVTQHYLAVD